MSREYPNNNCGECPVWLALGETPDFGYEQAVTEHCSKCQVYKGSQMEPCPFCGSSDIRYSLKTGTQAFKRVYHACWYCWDCNTYGPRVLYKPAGDVHRSTIEKDETLKAAALKLWNTRK